MSRYYIGISWLNMSRKLHLRSFTAIVATAIDEVFLKTTDDISPKAPQFFFYFS